MCLNTPRETARSRAWVVALMDGAEVIPIDVRVELRRSQIGWPSIS